MNDLSKELAALRGFVADLKSDREATKEKERREAWTKYTSMSIVCIAVLAAVATQWGGKYSSRVLVNLNDATYNQAQASDQWAFFQAKSIKQNLYELRREEILHENTPSAAAEADKVRAKVERYEKEKQEITAAAHKFEAVRDAARAKADHASKQGSGMGLAVSVYQISIAIGSICMVMKRRGLWYVSLALGVLATIQMILAWLA